MFNNSIDPKLLSLFISVPLQSRTVNTSPDYMALLPDVTVHDHRLDIDSCPVGHLQNQPDPYRGAPSLDRLPSARSYLYLAYISTPYFMLYSIIQLVRSYIHNSDSHSYHHCSTLCALHLTARYPCLMWLFVSTCGTSTITLRTSKTSRTHTALTSATTTLAPTSY